MTPRISAFLDGMRSLGYVEGQDFDIAYRFADNDDARLTALAGELVSLKPDVIVAADPPAAAVAKRATSSISIVAAMLVDPVNLGLVTSYARPDGNLTGIMFTVPGLRRKEVEIARELVPSATTMGLLTRIDPATAPSRHEIEAAGATIGVKIIAAEVGAKADLDAAFKALAAARVQAVLVVADPVLVSERGRIAALAVGSHLPTIFGNREFVEAGGLASYGVSTPENHRRAAHFVDKILKGAKPADLPVEFPTKIEMIINVKTAKALGLTVPPSIMLRADEVIE